MVRPIRFSTNYKPRAAEPLPWELVRPEGPGLGPGGVA